MQPDDVGRVEGGHGVDRDWQAMPAEAVLDRLDVAATRGLTSAAAAARLARDGPNRLPVEPPPGVVKIGVRQLRAH